MGDHDVADNLALIRQAIARAEADCDRPPGGAALIAVSKTVEAVRIEDALKAGQRLFGENYVQESQAKWPELRERWPDVELHLIGPLQSNKAGEAIALFDVIHSLDRPSLAKALAKAVQRAGRQPALLCQVNTGREPQKGGIDPDALPGFLEECRTSFGLAISGLMCIPPFDEPPSPHFAWLASLAADHGLALLSMGMSADFEAAIQLGATHVRVGSAIFGSRPQPAAA
ncbi:YggS family pyridoxal phosphate-dependent enzyme [Enterovirga rhinocerotis]|nr:YggS family pyridoxal phosphate-dependent enzyme [Enterovirga rhinocerotis]